MKKIYVIVSLITLTILSLVSLPQRAGAQGSDLGMSISVNPTQVSPGATVGVFGVVTNNTSKQLRTTVVLTSLSPCGGETSLGYHKLSLFPGQTIWVTASYPLSPDACKGAYTISISEKSSGPKGSSTSTDVQSGASCYLSVM